MREPSNIDAIAALHPDYLGFIFCARSKRNAADTIRPSIISALPDGVRTIGVFVDADAKTILARVQSLGLYGVQLHGQETPQLITTLKDVLPDLFVLKAFGIDAQFDFRRTQSYDLLCNGFLFDRAAVNAATPSGGSGIQFDWSLLTRYEGDTSYFLSGGIDQRALNEIKKLAIREKRLLGIDINSKVESAAGVKSAALITPLIKELRA